MRAQDVDIWADNEEIWAVDWQTDELVWRLETHGPIGPQAVVSSETLFVTSGLPFQLTAVDLRSGRTLWSYPERIYSNVVSSGRTVYALRGDGRLVALDASSGETIGAVELDPALATGEGRMPTYWLAACDSSLYLYIGESSELIALRLRPR
jgi:outer membrane protein assembly factor BamB